MTVLDHLNLKDDLLGLVGDGTGLCLDVWLVPVAPMVQLQVFLEPIEIVDLVPGLGRVDEIARLDRRHYSHYGTGLNLAPFICDIRVPLHSGI